MADVRRPRADEVDRVVQLLHESAADMYDRFAGGRERALRMLERAFRAPENMASAECVWVAEVDGEVAGAMAAFPVEEAPRRSRAFLRIALRSSPVWHWPGALRFYLAGGRASPRPPRYSFYVDALATDPRFRRRGAARALLAEAEREARERSLSSVALDTTTPNEVARRLYARAGYKEVDERPPTGGFPGFIGLVKRLG